MKKIGIITYLNIYNYGSFLQAFALKSAVEDLGYNAEFINVKYAKTDRYIQKLVMLKKLALHPRAIPVFKKMRNMGKSTIMQMPRETKELFDNCTEAFLPIRSFEYSDLKKAARTEYSAFIAGSDQIWSPLGLELRPHKFLEFAPKEKRLTYAPSFGVSDVPSYNVRKIRKNLKNINKLSVREESGREIIKKLTGKDAPVVLDPTLLAPAEFWESHLCDCPPDEPYVLCYFLSRPDETVVKSIREYAKKEKKRIVYMPYDHLDLFEGDAALCIASPLEFVSYIKNACAVFTDSFHGTAFSVIFKRSFYTFQRYSDKAFEQSSRITDLLQKINLSDRFIEKVSTNAIEYKDDLSELDEAALSRLRDLSEKYLSNSLDCIGE